VALLGKGLFDGTPDGAFSLNDLFEAALERETLLGVVLDAPWFHVGDPAALADAERRLSA
jgi:MurNAc alpha-1-phosphate uridylyltransferase